MACSCKKRSTMFSVKKKASSVDTPTDVNTTDTTADIPKATEEDVALVVAEALDVDLPQCYLCAKKHIGEAWVYFEELHTGYPDRLIRLVESFRVAEEEVSKAYILWQRTLAHLAMAGAELIGRRGELDTTLLEQHIAVANYIRNERINLQDNPLYVPDFEKMLIEVQKLQYAE